MTREEAIEVIKAKADYLESDKRFRAAVETIIPQLSESEDERIRKALIETVKCIYAGDTVFLSEQQRDRYLAYLEKQKERGPLTKEEEYILHRIIEYLEDETCPSEWISLLHDIYYLPYEKQKEEEGYEAIPVESTLEYKLGFKAGKESEKQKEQNEELVYRLNGLMQDYVKEGKDDEEKEHRLKCYQLFWDALEDTNFFEQKEQKPKLTPKWLYRLEFKDDSCGLWYNGKGEWCFESGIGSLGDSCKTKTLPMDYDERYKADGRDWFSSCSRKEDLLHWYSKEDARILLRKGFVFTRYLATEYTEYEQQTVFIKETALYREEIDFFSLFNEQKPAEWSEEDEKTIWGLTAYIPKEELERLGVTRDDILKKLKSLRHQPIQLKEAYKEGFQTARHAAALAFMNYLDENRPEGKMSLSNGECEDIDKAFKEGDWAKIKRYVEKYSPSWKPGEEQMNSLNLGIHALEEGGYYETASEIKELYEQLKKLM